MSTLTSSEIGITFLALTLLLIFSFIGGKLCELIKAPKVVGEIIGGMILGGSFIGYCWPDFFTSIFNAYSEEHKVLNIFYQLGLVFLMFSSGYTTSININKKISRITRCYLSEQPCYPWCWHCHLYRCLKVLLLVLPTIH